MTTMNDNSRSGPAPWRSRLLRWLASTIAAGALAGLGWAFGDDVAKIATTRIDAVCGITDFIEAGHRKRLLAMGDEQLLKSRTLSVDQRHLVTTIMNDRLADSFLFYSRAAACGSAVAKAEVGMIICMGLGVPKDIRKGTEMIAQARKADPARVTRYSESDCM